MTYTSIQARNPNSYTASLSFRSGTPIMAFVNILGVRLVGPHVRKN
jgi:hypothetical protein